MRLHITVLALTAFQDSGSLQMDPFSHTALQLCVSLCVHESVDLWRSFVLAFLCAAVLIPNGQRLAAYRSKCFHEHVKMTYSMCVPVCSSVHITLKL